MGKLATVALILIVSVVVPLGAPASTTGLSSTAALTSHPPVVLVHGHTTRGSLCEGINLASYWRGVGTELTVRRNIPAADVLPVSFYKCDTNGVDITGSGPGTRYPTTRTSGGAHPRAGYTNDASIVQIARDLAWFIHNEFTRAGRPVYAVGHSMGGLVIREALRRVQIRDPAFPPALDVRIALTIATPHTGWAKECHANTQCAEMTPGSRFLADLRTNPRPQGSNTTAWWAMGSEDDGKTLLCDGIPTDSAMAIRGVHLIYVDPCYRHCQYLNDDAQERDAEGSLALRGRHSLAMLGHVLR